MDCKLNTPFTMSINGHFYVLKDSVGDLQILIPKTHRLEAQIVMRHLNGIAKAIEFLQNEVQNDNQNQSDRIPAD